MKTVDTVTQDVILHLENISKRFGGIQALKDTSLDMERGQIIALVGENGAGKSTMINIISGLYPPDSGAIRFKGEQVIWPSPSHALRHGIAVVHQELTLFPNLTISENVFVGNRRMISKGGRVDRAHMRRETSRLLERLGLHLNVDRLVGTLSLAEQQLVEVAKALAWQPDLLILDEATSALDVHQVEALFQIVRKLRDQGVTILFVSHRMYEITQLCNQALVLKDGVIMAQFGEEEIASITQATLVEAMVGKTVSAMYPEKSHMHAAGALLQIEDLSTNLLKHVHMAVRPGEIVGLGGLRGHGQEELLRTLFGMSSGRISGQILLDQKPYMPRSPRQAVARGLAYVPPDRKTEGIAQRLDVEINLTSVVLRRLLQDKLGNLSMKKVGGTIDEIREQMNIGQRQWKQPVNSLSGGNQQKVALGKWLKSGFRVLLMDEPTRGIDVVTKHEIYNFLRRLTETGVSIVIVSTDALELLGISDRIYVFYEGSVQAVLEGDSLNEAMLTQAIMGMQDGEEFV